MKRVKREELLSRGMDGELSAEERGELDRLLESDPQLKKLESEWTAYSSLLKSEELPSPSSPEKAWSDVQRAMRLARPGAEPSPVFGWRLGWVGAIMGLVLLGILSIVIRDAGISRSVPEVARSEKPVEVEFVESDLPGASPMVYEDAESGWTVVWIAGLEEETEPAKGT